MATILKTSGFVVSVLCVCLTSGVKGDQESDYNIKGRTYFDNFRELNERDSFRKSPSYQQTISQVNQVLSNQELFGLNGILSETLSNIASGGDNDIHAGDLHTILRREVPSNFTRNQTQTSDSASDFQMTSASFPSASEKSSVFMTTVFSDRKTTEFESGETSDGTTSKTSELTTQTPTASPTSVPVTTERGQTTTTPGGDQPKSTCFTDMARIITGLLKREQWALQLVDSWGKPGRSLLEGRFNFVGNYHQCRDTVAPPKTGDDDRTQDDGFHGNYCVVGFSLGASGNSTPAGGMATMPMSLAEIGLCVPDTCSNDQLAAVVNQGLTLTNLSSVLTVATVDCRTDEREYAEATVVAIILLSIIGAFMIAGTAFDVVFIQWPTWIKAWRETHQPQALSIKIARNGYQPLADEENIGAHHAQDSQANGLANGNMDHPITSTETNGARPNGHFETNYLLTTKSPQKKSSQGCLDVLCKVLLSFSVYTNGQKVLNTSQPPGSLSAINGIRFLSMTWVILGHLFVFEMTKIENIMTQLPILLDRWTATAISNALVSVDTFFTLSGLLTAYVTAKELAKKGWKLNWGMFYFHRFWRLTPPYMLVLLTVLGLQRFMGSGALWATLQPLDKANCEDNWWKNLLYINNLFDINKICMGHSWYMSNDMQFFILSPLMLIPFSYHIYAGLGSCLVFLLITWITTGVLSTQNEWPVSIMGMNQAQPGGLDYMQHYYMAPYCRIGTYVIGIMTGYFLFVTKGKIRMPWYVVVIGWVVATATGLACVYGLYNDVSGKAVSSVGVAAFYNTMARSAWGACVCWVIVACVAGYGGPVNALLSWSPFVTLGRLTYMSYLIHPCLMYVYFGNMESLYYLNDTNLVISFLGILLFTNMASFLLMLAFESPMIGLEKVFLRKTK